MFGVEVVDVDMREATPTAHYPETRDAFETHSLLLFRNQDLDDAAHLRFGTLFGPIEDRSFGRNGPEPTMDNVTNRLADGSIPSEDDPHTLNLIANQLWHTDSTFLPVPALANILAARVLSSSGGETELVSTRVAWAEMPENLKTKIATRRLRHRLAHSRSKVSSDLAKQAHVTRWVDQVWPASWTNTVNGAEALYIASHACAVEGMADEEGSALIDQLIEFCTTQERVYTHRWRPGDVLVWDERATLHRGRPWPYSEERTLASICVSTRAVDGLDRMST